MPRIRNTDKFLRVDQNGKKLPEWKKKILDKKEKPKDEKSLVKKLINHYEKIIKQN